MVSIRLHFHIFDQELTTIKPINKHNLRLPPPLLRTNITLCTYTPLPGWRIRPLQQQLIRDKDIPQLERQKVVYNIHLSITVRACRAIEIAGGEIRIGVLEGRFEEVGEFVEYVGDDVCVCMVICRC